MRQSFKSNYPDIVRILRLAAYEAASWKADWSGRMSRKQRALLGRLRSETGIKLNIASGQATKPGWINVDVSPAADVKMDLRRPLPFQDGSTALIFTEHFCDHLNFSGSIQRFLKECHRVLAPGGRARFVLHDAEDLMRACLQKDQSYFELGENVLPTRMMAVNHLFRFNDFHQFLYDYETFALLLTQAGFSNVQRCKYLESASPDLVLDYVSPHREVLSMYIEAVK